MVWSWCLPCGSSAAGMGQGSSSSSCDDSSKAPASAAAPPVLTEDELHEVDVDEAQRWVVCRKAKPEARLRLICLPWAGGNSTIFSQWDLPDTEVVALELPGRQGRLSERPLQAALPIAKRAAQALEVLGYLRPGAKPLVVFGHSFGSLLAFHVASELQQRYQYSPRHVIVSGGTPIDVRGPTGVSSMTDDQVVDYLVSGGGLPLTVAENRELMELFLPAIRADYTAIDNYHYKTEPPLSCPMLALSGTNDAKNDPAMMAGWRRFTTSASFELVTVEGGHFFPKEKREEVLDHIHRLAIQPHLLQLDGNRHPAPPASSEGPNRL